MDIGAVIIVAPIVLAAIAFLAFALFQPQRGRKATEKVNGGTRDRWAMQTTLAELRREGNHAIGEFGQHRPMLLAGVLGIRSGHLG